MGVGGGIDRPTMEVPILHSATVTGATGVVLRWCVKVHGVPSAVCKSVRSSCSNGRGRSRLYTDFIMRGQWTYTDDEDFHWGKRGYRPGVTSVTVGMSS